MGKLRRAIESIKAMSTARDTEKLAEMFQKNADNFATVQKSWFRPMTDDELNALSDSDLEFIIQYVDIAISMHIKAIPHKEVKEIVLSFSAKLSDRIEPFIRIVLDAVSVDIKIDELWNTDLDLNRDMKRECVSLAEVIWFEYRPSASGEQLIRDAQIICEHLRTLYPAVQVSYNIVDEN